MERTIMIDGRPVPFKATGNTPRLYRTVFRRDIFRDINELAKAVDKANKEGIDRGSVLDVASLEIFENVAYIMAKQADSTIPSIENWLDAFNVFSVYEIMPQIIELWNLNTEQIAESKKNIAESKKKHRGIDREMTTALFMLRCYELGIPASDLDGLDVGAVFDMFTEKLNDDAEYCEIATQDDFDRF